MELLAAKIGMIVASILIVLSIAGLYKHAKTAQSDSEFVKVPKVIWCLFILFGLLIILVCYTVLFADESFWLIGYLSKFFNPT